MELGPQRGPVDLASFRQATLLGQNHTGRTAFHEGIRRPPTSGVRRRRQKARVDPGAAGRAGAGADPPVAPRRLEALTALAPTKQRIAARAIAASAASPPRSA
eukprot:6948959-Pyramimonas_sp.AAC.1